MELPKKSALVTGGGSGIGRALVERLTSEGCRVVSADVVPQPDGVVLDVSDAKEWARLAAQLDPLDIACLNAGVVTGAASIAELTDDQYRRIMGVNVDGVVLGVRALLPLLEADGGGAIVVTASLAGLVPTENDPIYAGTKHFLIGFVRSVAPQLRERGVTINAICPGIVETPLLGPESLARLHESGFPLLRPEEIAAAALGAIRDGSSGQAWACQPGRAPERFRFPGVPGPRVPGAEGMRPPI